MPPEFHPDKTYAAVRSGTSRLVCFLPCCKIVSLLPLFLLLSFFSYFKPLLFSLLFCIPVSAGASRNAIYCKSRTHGPCASFRQSLIRKRFVFARPSFRYVTYRYGRPSRIRNSSTFSLFR